MKHSERGSGCGALFLIPFVLVGIFLIYASIKGWYEHYLLTSSGDTTVGKVVRKWISSDSEGDETPNVEYRFEVGGTSYDGSGSVDWDHYESITEGAEVGVLFVADRPSVNRLEAYYGLGSPLFMTIFALFWNGFIAVFVVAFWKEFRSG